jgi:metalloendopeptidase OMA1, mitochondrial
MEDDNMTRRLLSVLLICLACGTVGCVKDVVSGKNTYNLYTLKDDVNFGTDVMQRQLKALKEKKKAYDSSRNAHELRKLQMIVKRIAAVSHYPKLPYEVHLADLPIPNAWCAPGGKMMVYEGLWDRKKGLVRQGNTNELAAVIAHEMSHATARHVTESLSRNMTIMLVGQAATSIIASGSASGGNLFGEVFSHGVNVFLPSYSRKNESEADRIGLIYMAKAGYDPRAAIHLWERAATRKGNRTTIFSSHPSSGSRAKALKTHLKEAMGHYKKSRK